MFIQHDEIGAFAEDAQINGPCNAYHRPYLIKHCVTISVLTEATNEVEIRREQRLQGIPVPFTIRVVIADNQASVIHGNLRLCAFSLMSLIGDIEFLRSSVSKRRGAKQQKYCGKVFNCHRSA